MVGIDFAGAWAAAGSRFAGCLETLSAGTPGWGVAGTNNCVIGSPANWRAISATSGDSTALVASTVTGNATAALRFGIEGDGAQAKGNYVAPIEFEVLAPG